MESSYDLMSEDEPGEETRLIQHIRAGEQVPSTSNSTRGCTTRFKKYKDCILFSIIGGLSVTVIALAIAIGLSEKTGENGIWNDWEPWGDCSATCDYGMERRKRMCSDSVGKLCHGDSSEYRICNKMLCSAIDGGWTTWSAWETCSSTCGTGLQSRNRTCTNPTPEPRGRPCFGDVSDQQLCNIKPCDGTGIGFSVYMPQNPPVFSSTVKFLNAFYNYNSIYNNSTGEFVCTKRGLYYIQSTLIRYIGGGSNPESYCYLNKNDKMVQYFPIYSSVSNPQATGAVLIDLLPGDRIYITGCFNIYELLGTSTFTAFLVHAD